MRGSRSSFQRKLTVIGLGLLGLALVVVVLNLLVPVAPGSSLYSWLLVLKLLAGLVLMGSWVLLNVPQPRPISGRFVLAVAEFGVLQPDDTVLPARRSSWAELLDTLPAGVALPDMEAVRGYLRSTQAPRREGRRAGSPTQRTPRPPGAPRSQTTALISLVPMDGDERHAAQARPPVMPGNPLAAGAWFISTLQRRWAEIGAEGLVVVGADFAGDGAAARAAGRAVNADAVLWGVMRPGRNPVFWPYVELLHDLERKAQKSDAELRMAGLLSLPLGPLLPQRPEMALALLSGLVYYASQLYRPALDEWNLALITAIANGDSPTAAPDTAATISNFYRGNTMFLMGDLAGAAAAFEAALDASPMLAEAQHNLGLVYHGQGRLDQARARIRRSLLLKAELAPGRYNLGVVLLTMGELDGAGDLFRKLLEATPDDAAAHRALGLVYRGAGRAELAAAELHEALRLRPDYVEVHTDLAVLYNGQGNAELARAELLRSIALDPNNPDTHYNYGLLLNAAGQVDTAVDEFKEALRLRPEFPEAQHILDVLYKTHGRQDTSAAQIKYVTALQPAGAETFITIGLSEFNRENYGEAVEKFRQALSIEPTNVAALLLLGQALARLHDPEAVAQLALLLRLPNPPAEAAYELAAIYRRDGDQHAAAAVLQQQVARDPHDARAYYRLGTIYVQQRRLDDAVAAFKLAVEYEPGLAEAYYNLGVAYVAQGKLHDAAAEFERATAANPTDAQSRYVLGITYRDLGQIEQAAAALKVATELRPEFPEAHYNLGLSYSTLGQPEQAIEEFNAVLRREPNHRRALFQLGSAYAAAGRVAAALPLFQHLADIDPRHSQAFFNLGVAYNALGEFDRAIEALNAALQIDPADAEALVNLGQALKNSGRTEAALAAFKHAIALRPDFAAAHYNLGQLYTAINEIDAAIKQFRIYEELQGLVVR